jgi:hypothetical protein
VDSYAKRIQSLSLLGNEYRSFNPWPVILLSYNEVTAKTIFIAERDRKITMNTNNNNFVALVRERTISTERPPLVREVSANFCGERSVAQSARRITYGRYLGFLDRIHYFFFQVAPQLYSRGSVNPVPGPLLRKFGSAGNRTRTSGSVARNSDHYTTEAVGPQIKTSWKEVGEVHFKILPRN